LLRILVNSTTNYGKYRKLLWPFSSGIWCCLTGNWFLNSQRNTVYCLHPLKSTPEFCNVSSMEGLLIRVFFFPKNHKQ
jgi:hypothetical protein